MNVNAVPDFGEALEVRGRDPFNLFYVAKASISGGLPTPGASNWVHVVLVRGLTHIGVRAQARLCPAHSLSCLRTLLWVPRV